MKIEKKKKVFKARAEALLSLQFYKDREGTMCFLITSNLSGKDSFCNLATGIDLMIFAKNFAQCENLDPNEKLEICKMFQRSMEEIKKQEENKQLRTVNIFQNGMVICFDGNKNQMPNLQGCWNDKKMDILGQDKGCVTYSFGTFQGHSTTIDRNTASRLSIEVIK